MKVTVSTDNMKFFECLSSKTRIRILELLADGPKNIGELAKLLNISSAITTRHINMLERAGFITTQNIPGKRGLQKLSSLCSGEIVLSFQKESAESRYDRVSIPIGQFAAHDVTPTCGLASTARLIGICDDPRYFSNPEKVNAALLWFQTGWVEYTIPSYIVSSRSVQAMEIVMEICSEYPSYNENWPSDIHFYINGVLLGMWTSPGDFGASKGIYTPAWWRSGTQYGLLKTLRITHTGSFMDGIELSKISLEHIPMEYGKDLSLRIEVPANARNPGGINIFGKGFGNYDQDIEVRVEYD